MLHLVENGKKQYPSLAFLPQEQFAQPGFFTAAEGGIARSNVVGPKRIMLRLMNQVKRTVYSFTGMDEEDAMMSF